MKIYGQSVSSRAGERTFSQRHQERMAGASAAPMAEEYAKMMENTLASVDVNTRNAIIKSRTFMQEFLEGNNAKIAQHLELVGEGRIDDSIFKDDEEMRAQVKTTNGREDAKKIGRMFGQMMGNPKGAMHSSGHRGGSLIMDAENMVGVMMQTAFVEYIQGMVDGSLKESSRQTEQYRITLSELQSSAIHAANGKYKSHYGDIGGKLAEAIKKGEDGWLEVGDDALFCQAIEGLAAAKDAEKDPTEFANMSSQLNVLERMLSSRRGFVDANRKMNNASEMWGKLNNFNREFRSIYRDEAHEKA